MSQLIFAKWTLKALPWTLGVLPVLTPPVKIHAPVVTAALIRPFPNTCLSLGWRSKFWRPPWTEMSKVGSSSCQSFTIKCRRLSGLVSYETRMYCKRKACQINTLLCLINVHIYLFQTVGQMWGKPMSTLLLLCFSAGPGWDSPWPCSWTLLPGTRYFRRSPLGTSSCALSHSICRLERQCAPAGLLPLASWLQEEWPHAASPADHRHI